MIGINAANPVNGQNYTADIMSMQASFPVTGALPTCKLTLSNRSNKYNTIIQPFSLLNLIFPNGVGGSQGYTFVVEDPEFSFNARNTINGGMTAILNGTAAPELLLLTEGNMDVVGTDIAVYQYDARGDVQANYQTPIQYVPYASTYVNNLNSNLLDVGNLLTSLLHSTQPDQIANYRGRLGYDATGAGIPTANGIDYTQGALNYFIKGQWQVGLGATGAQQYGLDIIKNVLTKNVVDASGNYVVLDFYVNPTFYPNPKLSVQTRGSVDSGQTFNLATDALLSVDLPYSTSDIMNFIIYWANDESQYPNASSAFSNYPTTTLLNQAWVQQGSSSLTQAVSTDTPFNSGTSNQYTGTNSATGQYNFSLGSNGYDTALSAPTRFINALNFYAKVDVTGDLITFFVYDNQGNSAQSPGISPTVLNSWQPYSITIPQSGVGSGANAWIPGSSGWDFGSNLIYTLGVSIALGQTGTFAKLSQIQFAESFNFSPDYSYNTIKAASSQLTGITSAGSTVLGLQSTAGFVPGQWITIDPFRSASETVLLLSRQSNGLITIASPGTKNQHSGGAQVVGATHDPNSTSAYYYRTFNFIDFYTQTGAADAADSIALNILNSRKGKKSTGTITVSGYAPQVPNIGPASLLHLVDSVDVYTPSASNVDSVVTGYVVDQIDYSVDVQYGFTATYTVEPWYATAQLSQISNSPTSPDTNAKNHWRVNPRDPLPQTLNRLRKGTSYVSPQI